MNRCDPSHRTVVEPIDPRIAAVLRYAIAIGAMLLLLLPAARGSHAALGWLPLWLLAMPLSAWWALHRFTLPEWVSPHPRAFGSLRRRRTGAQAHRRNRPARPLAVPRAA